MSLRNNTLYNLLGSAASGIAALISIPLLLSKIGDVSFGVLSLVWLLLGHFVVFDFGLSRATANRMARLAAADHLARQRLLWTSLWLNLAFGLAGAIILYLLAEPLMVHVFDIDMAVREEVLRAAPWIAAGVPLATMTAVLAGALDGRERFDVANVLQAFGAIVTQIAPLAAAYLVSSGLDSLIVWTVLARVLYVLLLLGANLRFVAAGRPLLPNRQDTRELFAYGAWISVSALIVPFFVTLDKFMIGAMLGAAAVAYYAVPDQLVRRMSVLPVALTRGLFPRLSSSEPQASRELSHRSARLLTSVITPAVAGLMLVMHPFLSFWIDPTFAETASGPGIILAAGIWLNSLAMVPSAYLQAIGRPQLTARSHLIEILPHVVIVWLLVRSFGVTGAAVAILLVTILDTSLLMHYARMPLWRMAHFWIGFGWILAAGLVAFLEQDAWWRYGAAFAVAFGSAAWAIRTSPELCASIAMPFRRRWMCRRG